MTLEQDMAGLLDPDNESRVHCSVSGLCVPGTVPLGWPLLDNHLGKAS